MREGRGFEAARPSRKLPAHVPGRDNRDLSQQYRGSEDPRSAQSGVGKMRKWINTMSDTVCEDYGKA